MSGITQHHRLEISRELVLPLSYWLQSTCLCILSVILRFRDLMSSNIEWWPGQMWPNLLKLEYKALTEVSTTGKCLWGQEVWGSSQWSFLTFELSRVDKNSMQDFISFKGIEIVNSCSVILKVFDGLLCFSQVFLVLVSLDMGLIAGQSSNIT